MTERGLFVTFEGVDGCGKTTQMRLLAERLRERGEKVIETAEPGGTAIGMAIRAILLDPAHHLLSPTAEMLLYFAARAQNVDEVLEPALAAGCIVVSDRWTDSTLAYQGAGRGLGQEVVAALDAIACRGRKPDLTVWVDIDLETSLERARRRNEEVAVSGAKRETRMDEQTREFYSRVREAYQRLTEAEPRRFARVDGRGTVAEVFERVWSAFHAFRQNHV
jgi:dTMP kinase